MTQMGGVQILLLLTIVGRLYSPADAAPTLTGTQPPYSYAASENMAGMVDLVGIPPYRSAVTIFIGRMVNNFSLSGMNTGESYFGNLTAIYNNFVEMSREQLRLKILANTTYPKRFRRTVLCGSFIFFTLCPDAGVEGTKKALSAMRSQMVSVAKLVDIDRKTTLAMASSFASEMSQIRLEMNVSSEIQRINFEKTQEAFRKIVDRMEVQEGSHAAAGHFEITELGGASDVKRFQREQDAMLGLRSGTYLTNSPNTIKVLASGIVDRREYSSSTTPGNRNVQRVVRILSYNYLMPGYLTLNLAPLDRRLGKNCYSIEFLYDHVVFSDSLSEILWFRDNVLVLEADLADMGNVTTLTKRPFCHSLLLRQLLSGSMFAPNSKKWVIPSFSPEMEKTLEDICFTSALGDSLLKLMGTECEPHSPLPGFLWYPRNSTLEFMGTKIFGGGPLKIIPDYLVHYFDPGTTRLDLSKFDEAYAAAERNFVAANQKSKRMINAIHEPLKWYWILCIVLGSVAVFLVVLVLICKLPKLCGATAATSIPLVPVQAATSVLVCNGSCPSKGFYEILGEFAGNRVILSPIAFKCPSENLVVALSSSEMVLILFCAIVAIGALLAYWLERKKKLTDWHFQYRLKRNSRVKGGTIRIPAADAQQLEARAVKDKGVICASFPSGKMYKTKLKTAPFDMKFLAAQDEDDDSEEEEVHMRQQNRGSVRCEMDEVESRRLNPSAAEFVHGGQSSFLPPSQQHDEFDRPQSRTGVRISARN